MASTILPEGWSGPDRWDKMRFTIYGPRTLDIRPPEREGWKVFFIGVHGDDHTTWTYKRTES